MNGRVAKKLRRKTYGQFAFHAEKKYTRDHGSGVVCLHHSDPRSAYKMEKVEYYQEKQKRSM